MIPPRDPIMALIEIRVMSKLVDQKKDMLVNMKSGGIFCHELRVKSISHDKLVIMGGIHMWHGALPIFIKIENNIIQIDRSVNEDEMYIKIDKRRVTDLTD